MAEGSGKSRKNINVTIKEATFDQLLAEIKARAADEIGLPDDDLDYDEWLEFFRKKPSGLLSQYEKQTYVIPTEGCAALKRWIEILKHPSKMDKLHQGRLRQDTEKDILDIAVGDDDEAVYVALIRENVSQLNTSNISQQEVARLTQNINIFRKELQEIRSRKPKKGTLLEKVLEKAAVPPKSEKIKKPAKKKASKTPSKASKTKKTSKTPSKKQKG